VDGPEPEQSSLELERFCVLGLAANPTVLECLWSPLADVVTDVGRELIALRESFLSRRLAQTYGAYARDQFTKLEATRRRTGTVKGKQAMHMLRLLMAGAHVLSTRQILVDLTAMRDRFLAVKRGEVSWDEIRAWASALEDELDRAAQATTLPAEPDRPAVNDFLIRTRRDHL